MIHIFFVPGMHGTMIEMALLGCTNIDKDIEVIVSPDGSCHEFKKNCHITDEITLDRMTSTTNITTVIYPSSDHKLDQILTLVGNKSISWESDSKILIHAKDSRWAEINMLFQYHKISIGLGKTLDIFGGNINDIDIKNWNPQYDHYTDMQRWEYREWLSLFYPLWIQEWILSPSLVSDNFLCISNQDIIEHTQNTLETIMEFCGHRPKTSITAFCKEYRAKQQYILDEYHMIEEILQCTLTQQDRSWDLSKLSIVGEAILQSKFRELGYEWRCHDLDILPTTSVGFDKIIFVQEQN